MFKNQLQELAQRSCFNLPSYGSRREGPDHAPRFKAFVNFNGEIFESPSYSSTLRQAEHYAAEAALSALSSRGSKSLTARVLDETGVYKNLLQETAHKAGLSLPLYTTVRSGPGHVPVFTCTVDLAGLSFNGSPAKTKKQAEKNAAIAAWSSLKKMTRLVPMGNEKDDEEGQEQEQVMVTRMLSNLQPAGRLTEGRNNHNLHHHQFGRRRRIERNNIVDRKNRASSYESCLNQQQLPSSVEDSQKHNSSFVDLLPPRTTSKILSLGDNHYRRRNWVDNKFIARRRDKTAAATTTASSVIGSLFKRSQEEEEQEQSNTSTSSSPSLSQNKPALLQLPCNSAVPGQGGVVSDGNQLLLLLQGQNTEFRSNSIPNSTSATLKGNTSTMSSYNGGFGFNPRSIAPSVQIRSVIHVCASPPRPPVISDHLNKDDDGSSASSFPSQHHLLEQSSRSTHHHHHQLETEFNDKLLLL